MTLQNIELHELISDAFIQSTIDYHYRLQNDQIWSLGLADLTNYIGMLMQDRGMWYNEYYHHKFTTIDVKENLPAHLYIRSGRVYEY